MNVSARAELEAVLRRLAQLLQQGAAQEAEALAARARHDFPLAGDLVRLHGVALLQLGRAREARAALHRAAELAPGSLEVQCNLAQLALEEGQPQAAIERLRATLPRHPGHPGVLQVLGMALMAAARYEEAREAFAQALRAAPQHPALCLHLAEAELELGANEQALEHARAAVRLAPEADVARALLGHVLRALGRLDEAAAAWLEAERLAPRQARHAFQAGLMLEEAGRLAEAAEAYARALRLAPDSGPALSRLAFARRRLADWREQLALTARLRDAVAAGRPGILPLSLLFEPFDRTVQHQATTRFAARIEEHLSPLRRELAFARPRPSPKAPVRVGLVSDGFGDHWVGRAVVPVVEALAAVGGLELHLFASTADDGSVIRRRLAAAASLHAIEGLPPARAATRIHALGIEVLLDLTGYGPRTHAELFALRPAPVQVGWLAYPGTSGAPWMDYLLADRVTLPASHRDGYSEKVLRLPRCFLPVDPGRTPALPPSRPECGLPDAGVVFACFNATAKLNPDTFARFMRILREVPDSVLWLRAGTEGTAARLRAAASAHDVAPERLVFLPPLPHAEHLARFALADLCLDTLPCSAHATAADALAAGCPLLTCAGATFAGRVAASLLSHAHLPELVAEGADAFVATAVRLGRDREALADLRARVFARRTLSPLFDVAGFADDFHRVLQAIGTRQRIGRPPIDLDF
ncbi:tetratricopeptide repeat protein [Fulvimonas yonginensis]|uniref:protein O-GlcNAc transferase n=1 Tax=Fulvimonas yonginensis TaxID=1495200 RepID=A0ABU8J8W8_9GAMM